MSVLRSPLLLAALSGWHTLTRALDHLQAPASLLARGYVAEAFFRSGLTKLRDWETTLALFGDEYHVPLLSPGAAAVLGTTGELVLPVLLVAGLGGRLQVVHGAGQGVPGGQGGEQERRAQDGHREGPRGGVVCLGGRWMAEAGVRATRWAWAHRLTGPATRPVARRPAPGRR